MSAVREWHFYRLSDGIFIGRSIGAADEKIIALNTPNECGAIEGVYDWRSQRVDLSTGEVIDYRPPAPDADHVWVHDDERGNRVRRWVLKAEAAALRAQQAVALTRIVELENKQKRIDRELKLRPHEIGSDGLTPIQRLQKIDEEIARLRDVINGTGTSAR